MADNNAYAKKVYESVMAALDGMGWTYDRYDEDMLIKSGVKGDDLPIQFLIKVDGDRSLLSYWSKLPFATEEEKRIDMALAICAANNRMADGCFDYDVNTGEIVFRLTASFKGDAVLPHELLEYVVMVSAYTIDKYNDQFFMISKGALSVEQFIKHVNE